MGGICSSGKTTTINWEGDKRYYKNGRLHRINGPAVEMIDGDREWYKNGGYHREGDYPAMEYTDGYKAWYKNNKLYRKNGPAIIFANGKLGWYRKNGDRYYPSTQSIYT